MVDIGLINNMDTIYTLNARDNFLLELTQDYFNLNSYQIFNEINSSFIQLKNVLSLKGIQYEDLKSALIPNIKKNEVLFVFDSSCIDNNWYGYEVFNKIIPIFDQKSNHSILSGDFTDIIEDQQKLHLLLKNEINLKRGCTFRFSNQFFFVYINNLSDSMIQRFDTHLTSYYPYLGHAKLNFLSKLKAYVSFVLCPTFIKHINKIILAHEDDVSNNHNQNTLGYPFEEYGYKCYSLQSMLYGLFLSYKIERPVVKNSDKDTLFSINAISDEICSLSNLDILVKENKLQYLANKKEGILKKAELTNCTVNEIEQKIKDKINENYIYNLVYLEDSNTLKFNLTLEFETKADNSKIKLLLALEYLPKEKLLRLITLY